MITIIITITTIIIIIIGGGLTHTHIYIPGSRTASFVSSFCDLGRNP
jgi:uncharacterized protein YxeA